MICDIGTDGSLWWTENGAQFVDKIGLDVDEQEPNLKNKWKWAGVKHTLSV